MNERWHLHKHDIDEDSIQPKDIELKDGADAFILDLPEPWKALDNVLSILKPGGTLAIYVPTYNQLINGIKCLEDTGRFTDIHALENLEREVHFQNRGEEIIARPESTGIMHTGFLIFAHLIED